MKKILVFFMFLLSLTSLAQRFVVVSKDGYANLREEASTKSKILAKVDNSYIIYNIDVFYDPEEENTDWYCVGVDKNDFFETGCIHKSQLAMHPETYVTSSKEGYVNVRAKPSTSSKVLFVLDIDKSYVTRHPKKTVGDWYYVDYYNGGETALYQGYIHKSQLKKVKQ